MFSTSFHITDAADIIATIDPTLAVAFRNAPHFRRYAIAEMFRGIVDRRGGNGEAVYDSIFARLEMHSEIKK